MSSKSFKSYHDKIKSISTCILNIIQSSHEGSLTMLSTQTDIFDIYPVYPPWRIFLRLPFQGFHLVCMDGFVGHGWDFHGCDFQAIMLRWKNDTLWHIVVIASRWSCFPQSFQEGGSQCSTKCITILTWKLKCFRHFQVWQHSWD